METIEEIDFCLDHGGCSIYAECSNSETEVRVFETGKIMFLEQFYYGIKDTFL